MFFFGYNDQKTKLSLKIVDLEPWASKQVKSSSEWPPRLGNCCRTSRWHSLPSKQPFVNTSPQPKKRVDHNLVSSRVFWIGKDLDWIDQWRRELKTKLNIETKSRSWIPELTNTHHKCHVSHCTVVSINATPKRTKWTYFFQSYVALLVSSSYHLERTELQKVFLDALASLAFKLSQTD